MDYSDADPSFRAHFVGPKFDPDAFIQSIASKSIGSTDLVNMKGRMYLISSEAKTDLKQNIYRNHTKFIETAKQVASLESEVNQLHSLLCNEKQLINTVKELLNVENKPDVTNVSDLNTWDTFLRHCQSLGLVSSNTDRQLIHSGRLLEAKLENLSTNKYYKLNGLNKSSISYTTHLCYGLLFNDCFIIIKSSNVDTATAYDVDQVIKIHRTSINSLNTNKNYSTLTGVQIINIKDDLIRNAFSIKYNLETVTMICDNTHIKNQWIEMFENVLYRDSKEYLTTSTMKSHEDQEFEEEFFAEEWIRNIQENLTIYLVERNFDQILILIHQAKTYIQKFLSQHEQQSITFIDEFIKDVQEKEQDLYKLIEKEIIYIGERGCSTNLLKYYYHHIQILKQLGYISKACDLFFILQLSLMKTTLKQTKLEELNVAFVENFVNIFFTRLVDSYYEFVQIFQDQKSTFTKFIIWMTIEIEKLIINLQNQQYIGIRNYTFTMKNIRILLTKADEFSLKLIDVKFIFEEQLEQLLIQIIRTQKDLIIDTLRKRHRDEKWFPITFQTQERLDQLFNEFNELDIDSQTFLQPFINIKDEQDLLRIDLAPSTLQFSKAYLTFARDLFRIHYLAINQIIIEALVELIKLHLKYYERTLQKTKEKNLKIFIMKNVDFSLNYLFKHVDQLYKPKIGNAKKYFTRIYDKMNKLKELAEN